MEIAELLNGPTASKRSVAKRHAQKRMDMASHNLFTQKRKHRLELSMSRIIQELAVKEGFCHVSTETESEMRLGLERKALTKAKTKTKATKHPKGDTSSSNKNAVTKQRRAYNGFTPLTESEKRVKQRMLVKKLYYRKIDTLVELRNEVETLENKCNDMVISRRQIRPNSSLEAQNEEEEEEQRCESLREQYAQLAITQCDLRYENEKLRLEAMEQSKARTRIGILLNEELQDQNEACTKGEALGLSPWSSSVPRVTSPSTDSERSSQDMKVEPVLDFIPITKDECLAIVRESYADVRAFADKQHHDTTGARVFGWRDRRQVDGDTMRFFLEKTFERYTAAEVSSRVWDLVSSEHGVNRIYASDIAIDFRLVQRIDEDNVLFYRTIEPIDVQVVLKALILASRVQIDDNGSFMVLFRSVDPLTRGIVTKDTPDASGFSIEKKEVWGDVFSWGLYEAVGNNGQYCRNCFGGFVSKLLTQRSLEFWLMHILLIAVRCESEVIGPLFIMQ